MIIDDINNNHAPTATPDNIHAHLFLNPTSATLSDSATPRDPLNGKHS